MPTYLDFDTTKQFRNYIIGKTLTDPSGPQSFTASNYTFSKTSDMSNIDPGTVDSNRPIDLLQPQTSNVYKPTAYNVTEYIATIPRSANLQLYPAFVTGQNHNLYGIVNGRAYDTESQLFKFAAWNIQSNPDGPFFARVQQNLYTTTVGRVRIIDALEGNTATAINILTGKEPLIEKNEKITVAKTLPGKVIDFAQTLTGVEFPFSEIPGYYLTDPRNPVISRPPAATEGGKVFQDITGALGSLVGVQRRPLLTRKPSDLFIEYLGNGPKSTLFDNLSFSKYAPDYTTTAMSQNTSKLFNYVDQFAQGAKSFLGLEAPKGVAYIGDDRSNDVKYAMGDFYDRPVRSSYYLSIMFDPLLGTVFQRKKNIGEGGGIGGNLTWISSRSKNKLGVNNAEYASEASQLEDTLSTKFPFRADSILGLTQQILETLPTDGGASRSHVANVIDQTSRVFREDDLMISRGSAIKYVDKFSGTESGVEYCRVWTKDRSYMNNSDTMKTETRISRKFDSSVYNGPWNLNIYPNSNGNGAFDSGSTNLAKGKGDGFYAKKYMFSIENLAWKQSNTPGFTYNDLPYCERGPNGGRVMWFPPYDLKVQEQNSAKWESNIFLGRPEPVYTYQNTQRTGSISFKVIVDHPSILNLLVREHFKNMSDEEADNYINAFFAGCETVDFYGMIRKYTTLTEDDVKKIQSYLNGNKDPNTIKKYKTVITPIDNKPVPKNEVKTNDFSIVLYFQNDYPNPRSTSLYTSEDYEQLYNNYISYQPTYMSLLESGIDSLSTPAAPTWGNTQKTDYMALTSIPKEKQTARPSDPELADAKAKAITEINTGFSNLTTWYGQFKDKLTEIKTGLENGTVQNIKLKLGSRTSSVADDHYNLDLSYRRSYSILRDIVKKTAATSEIAETIIKEFKWKGPSSTTSKESIEPAQTISLGEKGLGYKNATGTFVIEYVQNTGEQPVGSLPSGSKTIDCSDKFKVINTNLKITAPITFWCRESDLKLTYETKDPDKPDPTPIPGVPVLTEITETSTGVPTTPPIDEMKRIVMKTLAECYYFKKLEEDSPVQFSSLREKLRYFHPAFHSMTPEGLNARLTFLHQCIRPGETLPIKGVSDVSDLNARNTTFGPPPICVMRIGDFYHSKVAIADVNIEYEQNLWDMNPEGIGVQPMIANVTLQVNFIGGHGLAKPVERLQNALSSNFYANTEIYDPRSISTETSINGQDVSKFTKEFLETLVKDNTQKQNTTSQEPVSTDKNITQGVYIGTFGATSVVPPINILIYTDLVKGVFTTTKSYFETFKSSYKSIMETYDAKISALLLSPTYRTINTYTVQTGVGTDTIPLLGEYKKNSELPVLVSSFKEKILANIDSNNITSIFGFASVMTPAIQSQSERILKPYVTSTMGTIIDSLTQVPEVKKIEESRNAFIKGLDGLNFILETLGDDGKIDKDNYIGVQLTGFTSDMLYPFYQDNIALIKKENHIFTDNLDGSYVFDKNTTMTINDLTYFLQVLLRDKNGKSYKNEIMDLYKKDPKVFSPKVVADIEKKLIKFLGKNPTVKDVKIKYPTPKNDKPIQFNIGGSVTFNDTQKQALKSVFNTSRNITTNVLNYYR